METSSDSLVEDLIESEIILKMRKGQVAGDSQFFLFQL